MRYKELPIAEIVARYQDGMSTLKLESIYGVDRSTIWRRLRSAGVKMRRCGAPRRNKNALGNRSTPKPGGPLHLTSDGYLQTYDREKQQCRLHRGCWAAHYGEIPEGYVVHHINKETLDNRIENLACMSANEHSRLHHGRGDVSE